MMVQHLLDIWAVLALLVLLVICCTLAGCNALRPAGQRMGTRTRVPLAELVADPSRYDGQNVCTAGIYVQGFEASSLGASTYQKDGRTYLAEPVVWIEGADVTAESDCVDQIDDLSGQRIEFCPATICGRFEHCRACGHLDGYSFQLTRQVR